MKEYNYRIYLCLIYTIWVFINFILFNFIDNETRVLASADALSWITPAKNFFLYNNFISEGEYENLSVYRTPIIPILLSLSFFFSGLNSFNAYILFQIFAILITSILLLRLVDKWEKPYKIILISLFLFNPNIISTGQLIQSEIFTMCFFFICFFLIIKHQYFEKKMLNSLLIGVFFGITILTRPSILFLLFLLPFIFYLLSCKNIKDFSRVSISSK